MSIQVNNNVNIWQMRADSMRDTGSSASNHARDMMEMFNPMNVLKMVMQIFQMLGSLSG